MDTLYERRVSRASELATGPGIVTLVRDSHILFAHTAIGEPLFEVNRFLIGSTDEPRALR